MAPTPTASAAINGWSRLASPGMGGDHEEGEGHGRGDPQAIAKGLDQAQPELQEDPGDHGHDDGHGEGFHGPADPAAEAQNDHQKSGSVKGADHLRKAQMVQRRPHQDDAWDGPKENQGLAVEQAIGDADQPVEEETSE